MISVSICTYHTATDELDRCLDSLTSPVVDSITIVDNGNERRIADYAKSKNINYIPLNNPGYGAAHNRALLSTASRYHLVVNSDVSFEPALLDHLAAVMDANPEVTQLQPRVLLADGTDQYASRRLPSPWILIGRRFFPRLIERANRRYLLQDMDLTQPLRVPYQTGCFMLVRTADAVAIGGFDERFFMYPEDIDLSRRLNRRGPVVYYPGRTIIHAHAADSYRSRRMLKIHVVNMTRYFLKWAFENRRRDNATIAPYPLRRPK